MTLREIMTKRIMSLVDEQHLMLLFDITPKDISALPDEEFYELYEEAIWYNEFSDQYEELLEDNTRTLN